jgi:hypothetical protein
LLTFCLDIQNGEITGNVFESLSGLLLSSVTGMFEPINSENNLMTLFFAWPPTRVMMVGFTFRTAATGEILHFQGRFGAFASLDWLQKVLTPETRSNAQLLLTGPGDSDTGTGTGQQT